jgi:wyosine [tRNA(Phe)-imidazoG37] synthetase (radical SAM superfamily)
MDTSELERIAQAWADHGRHFDKYDFVYPVVSRRAGGISLGVNLNPDLACNFDCPYCQVDRTASLASTPALTINALRTELMNAIAHWMHNRFTDSPRFAGISPEQLDLKDICLSGDGESTMVPQFEAVCALLAEVQDALSITKPKLVLITNATLLHQEKVRRGLQKLTAKNGEIWGKLDAGTEAWFQIMSRSRFTLSHIESNLISTVAHFPLRIQTMLCTVDNALPSEAEIKAYAERIQRIVAANPRNLLEVQLYSIIRRTATSNVGPVPEDFLQETAKWLSERMDVSVNAY